MPRHFPLVNIVSTLKFHFSPHLDDKTTDWRRDERERTRTKGR